jgi:riboflavin biosynthesis pyrimidine reductase
MAVIASFVMGANGASTLDGKSAPLSTPADRERFLSRHRSAAAFIIGKASAQVESYAAAKVPIFVFSRSSAALTFPHPLMQQVTVDRGHLGDITRIIDHRIDGDIVVEAGASLLIALIEAGVIDEIELTISPRNGDGNFFNLDQIYKNFSWSEVTVEDGTRLLQGRYKRDSTHG